MIANERSSWVSYLRVSTQEQAERDLSLPAQRDAIEEYARRNGKVIDREYVEPGQSGFDVKRKVFRQMLQDVLRPGSDIGVIIVNHTSRFTRNATQARVVKEQLRKKGVRVISVCQDMNDDPIGQLIEGIFECIDQYESELTGLRTVAAMREAVRQGFFPGAASPYGYKTVKKQIRPGLFRSVLAVDKHEAEIVRELFQLYVANNGAKNVARALNKRKHWYRNGKLWSKDLVLKVLDESAISGTYYWGKHETKTKRKKDQSEWLPLTVKPIVEPELYELARQLRSKRQPTKNPGRAASPETLLSGVIRCAKCGSAYALETSGKSVNGEVYKYRYYNCRKTCRIGKEACPGGRISTSILDTAVLEFIAEKACTRERSMELIRYFNTDAANTRSFLKTDSATIERVQNSWSAHVCSGGTISKNYLHHIINRIEVDENNIKVLAKDSYSTQS